MKTRKKVLLVMLSAVSLVTASVLGTVAYLTADAAVVNTFTVGAVTITMDEKDVDNSSTGERDTANTYKLVPGNTYEKDPTIHVAQGSEDCYLFVKVENDITAIEGTKTVAAQMKEKGWKQVEGQNNIYVYAVGNAAKTAVKAGTNVTVFDNFTIADTVDGSALEAYKPVTRNGVTTYKSIKVTAYAVQVDGFTEKTPAQIWDLAF